MKPLSLAVLFLAALIPTRVLADPQPPITAGIYKVETRHTLVEFTVNHFGFNDFFGVFPGATGTLELDPNAIAASKLEIFVPVDLVSTTSAKLDSELKSADWFDSAHYSTIRFVSQSVQQTGPNTALINGLITLHGVTRPLTLQATLGGSGVNPMDKAFTVGFSAIGKIKRSEFGVSKYVPYVSDEVQLKISAAFEKAN